MNTHPLMRYKYRRPRDFYVSQTDEHPDLTENLRITVMAVAADLHRIPSSADKIPTIMINHNDLRSFFCDYIIAQILCHCNRKKVFNRE